jgi:ribosomal protein L34E
MKKSANPEKLICESCGNSLECGAKTGNCWCFEVAISPDNLAQLNRQYKNCLCRACLDKISSTANKNTLR